MTSECRTRSAAEQAGPRDGACRTGLGDLILEARIARRALREVAHDEDDPRYYLFERTAALVCTREQLRLDYERALDRCIDRLVALVEEEAR